MSKLSKLKQEAYLAGKKRDWEAAISVYQQILELDKSNPTLINELGDLFLKQGHIPQAIEHFLSAAAKYRHTGLQNNAVAIYKKILRHEPANLNAHWYLAEIRANQGLIVDGAENAKRFLAASDSISSEMKDLHLKRCVQMLSLYGSSGEVLEQLLNVFDFWDMEIEKARVWCLVSCLEYDQGDQEEAARRITAVVQKHPEIVNYSEFAAWRRRTGEGAAADFCADVNTVSFDAAPAAEAVETAAAAGREAPAAAPTATPRPRRAATVDEADFSDLELARSGSGSLFGQDGTQESAAAAPNPATGLGADFLDRPEDLPAAADRDLAEAEDDGCFAIEPEAVRSFDEILRGADDIPAPVGRAERAAPEGEARGGVDLLAEILADDSQPHKPNETGQLNTIAHELGQMVGASGEDAGQLYEMGMVYLEMGLTEQACACFEQAAADPEHALRALEMWAVTLRRAGREAEAVRFLQAALAEAGGVVEATLGLCYQLGRAHEATGSADQARRCYEQVSEIAPAFLDVSARLSALATVP